MGKPTISAAFACCRFSFLKLLNSMVVCSNRDGRRSQEKQVVQIFPAKGTIAMDKIRALLSGGCRLALIKGVDNQNSISCCGVFRTGAKTNTGSAVSVGCMMRLECNPQSLKYRITVRALHKDVGMALKM